jgi:hypothetical protein
VSIVVSHHEPTPVVQRRETSVVVTRQNSDVVVTRQVEARTVVVTRGIPGPPGRDGDAAGGALLAVNQLSEFDTETKKAAARANLGLGVIDGGTFN